MRLILSAAPALALALAFTAPALAAGAPSRMKVCGGKWSAMSAAEKGRYNDRAKGMKSKKGNSLSGYNVWTGECMRKG